jgi:hypothetical protein
MKREPHRSDPARSHRSPSALRRVVVGGLSGLSLFLLFCACAPAESPKGQGTAENRCLRPGGHCEFDDQCCSGRCQHETGCVGGTP